MKKVIIYIVLTVAVLLYSCREAQKIEVVLPEYQTKPMVECYLIPGQRYKLLLTQSVPILAEVITIPIEKAIVTITHLNKTDTLFANPIFVDPDDTTKFYNYINFSETIPEDYKNEFELKIKIPSGLVIKAKTKITKPAEIDSALVYKNNETRFVSIFVKDKQKEIKHYRFMVFQDSQKGLQTQSVITDNQKIRFSPYIFYNQDQIIFNSKTDFFIKETGEVLKNVAIRAICISEEYFDFLQSVRQAQNSNNPFAQPASIRSNVSNGVGIFTGFNPVLSDVDVPQ